MIAPKYLSFASFGLLALAGCGTPAPGGEAIDSTGEAIGLSSTHLYLRCNATGFGLTNANRLQPTSNGRLATLTFQVNEP